jgi:hypothetical protein
VLPNTTQANDATELVAAIRQQVKEGADFVKIYETGKGSLTGGRSSTPFQFTAEEMEVAVREAARVRKHVAVHATRGPGTLYAAQAGVVSIDHAFQLSQAAMKIMRDKQIFALPSFTIFEYFADHAETPAEGVANRQMLDYYAREFVLMVQYGMTPLAATHTTLRYRREQGGYASFPRLFGLKEDATYPGLSHYREHQERDSGDELGGGLEIHWRFLILSTSGGAAPRATSRHRLCPHR